MPHVANFKQFGSLHWETGTVKNVLAHKQVTAPHTGEAFSEALLFGLTGGVGILYFVFEYVGYEPFIYLGTRYHDAPVDALLNRLGINATVRQTSSPKVAAEQLLAALDKGEPAIVMADLTVLSYNRIPGFGSPAMFPLVVYGYDEATGLVQISDRSRAPLTASAAELATARAAQGSLKHRLLTLSTPGNLDNLPAAVLDAIRTSMTVMTEGPDKGPKSNFGLAALLKWADLLTDAKDKKGWPQVFAGGPRHYAALVWIHRFIEGWGSGGQASRPLYAEFLAEAATLLGKPELDNAGDKFRQSGAAWQALADAILPDNVAPFAETRELTLHRSQLFLERGMDAQAEIAEIAQRLEQIKNELAAGFPLDAQGIAAHRQELREHVLQLHEAESDAVHTLTGAVAA